MHFLLNNKKYVCVVKFVTIYIKKEITKMLSTSLTGLRIRGSRVYLVLLGVLECEHWEHCLRCLSASRAEHRKLTAYIVVVKSPTDLTC